VEFSYYLQLIPGPDEFNFFFAAEVHFMENFAQTALPIGTRRCPGVPTMAMIIEGRLVPHGIVTMEASC